MSAFVERLAQWAAEFKPVAAARLRRLLRPTWHGVGLALCAVLAGVMLYVLFLIPFTPSIGDIRKARLELPAQVYSADGKLLAEFKPGNREWVPLSDVSPHVVDALISTEDHRFYQHGAIDWRRTLSAALHTLAGDRQGGSTITQQLARNLYPDQIGRAPTLTRKIKEAITAYKIESVYTKKQILETYLNTVPFLYDAYGIEMAARTYFGKSADELNILESATLVGMLKGNAYYNPVLNPERALQRRNIVLAQMVKYGRLSQAQFDRLKRQPLRLDFQRLTESPGPAPHFAQQLRKWLIGWADRNGYNIYTDGLVVRTTIDSRLQALANQAVARQGNLLQGVANAAWGERSGWAGHRALVESFVRESADYRAARDTGLTDKQAMKQLMSDRAFMRGLREDKTRVQAGFLAIDPDNGEIKAWVGSRDYSQDAFDHVSQARRQPGSTFKAFVYGAAFEDGAKPDDKLVDKVQDIPLPGGGVWKPKDDEAATDRPMTLRDALANSINTIAAQLIMKVGPDKVASLARAMGVRSSKLDPVPSLALGTSPVTLKEMVTAYGTIADGGSYIAPMMVTSIESRDGKVLAQFRPARPERALSAQATADLIDAMRAVVDHGTGAAIRSRYGIRADVAGKTGTTQDNADGWFILMSPQLVAGAWVGFNDSRITLRSNYWGQGAHSALPIVGEFFQGALHARLIDAHAHFAEIQAPNWRQTWRQTFSTKFRAWMQYLFGHAPKPAAHAPQHPAPHHVPQPSPMPAMPEPGSTVATPQSLESPGAASGASPITGPTSSAPAIEAPAQSSGVAYPPTQPITPLITPPQAPSETSPAVPSNTQQQQGLAPAGPPVEPSTPTPAPAPSSRHGNGPAPIVSLPVDPVTSGSDITVRPLRQAPASQPSQ